MKRPLLLFTIIIILSSCSNVMKQKMTTNDWDTYLKTIRKIDTLDKREKDYVIEQSKKAIINVGLIESQYKKIGLKPDTSKLITFGNFYKTTVSRWRNMNLRQKNIMSTNLLLDTATEIINIKQLNVKSIKIDSVKDETRAVNNQYIKYNFYCYYTIEFNGLAEVHPKQKIESFIPSYKSISSKKINYKDIIGKSKESIRMLLKSANGFDFYDFDGLIFHRSKGNMYKFSLTYSNSLDYYKIPIDSDQDNWNKNGVIISDFDADYFKEHGYIDSDKFLKDKRIKVKTKSLEKKLLAINNRKYKFKIDAVSKTSWFPSKKQEVDPEFLTQAEYQEYEKIFSGNLPPDSLKLLKVKYGIPII